MRPRKLKHGVGTLTRQLTRHTTPAAGHPNPSQEITNKNVLTHLPPNHPPLNHSTIHYPTTCLTHTISPQLPTHSSTLLPTSPTRTTTPHSMCPINSVFCVKQPPPADTTNWRVFVVQYPIQAAIHLSRIDGGTIIGLHETSPKASESTTADTIA